MANAQKLGFSWRQSFHPDLGKMRKQFSRLSSELKSSNLITILAQGKFKCVWLR